MRKHNVQIPLVAAIALTLAGAFSLAVADQVVYFTNGKAMMVKKVEPGDVVTILELEGGGRLGVPSEQILRIEEYAVSQPNGARPPAAQQPRAAASIPPPPPGVAGQEVSAAAAVSGAAVNEPANLVADAPAVVPDPTEDVAVGLAAPRGSVHDAGAPPQASDVAAVSTRPQDAGQVGSGTSAAAAIAAQQSAAARMDQRQRSGQLNSPRGRPGSGDMHRGQALMGGQSPRRPGQGVVQGGTAPPADARAEEEILPAASERRGGKQGGDASEKASPPPEDGDSEQPPSGAN